MLIRFRKLQCHVLGLWLSAGTNCSSIIDFFVSERTIRGHPNFNFRKALKTNEPDAQGPGRSFAEVALATPIYVSVQESWKGLDTRNIFGCGFLGGNVL